jgi:hypothetical protein
MWELFCLAAVVVFIAAMLLAAYAGAALLLVGRVASPRWPTVGKRVTRCGRGIFRGMSWAMSSGRSAR